MLDRLHGQGFKTTFGIMKQQIFGSSHYDPYQRDQVLEEQQGAVFCTSYDPWCQQVEIVKKQQAQQQQQHQQEAVDAANQQQEEATGQKQPSKLWSLTSVVVDTISMMAYELFSNTAASASAPASAPAVTAATAVEEKQDSLRRPLFRGRDNDFTLFKKSPDWEHRMQKAEKLIRGISLQSQQQQREQYRDSLNYPLAWRLSSITAKSYHLAAEEKNSSWNLVDKADLKASFLGPMSPPKPKRSYIIVREVSTPPAAPVGIPSNYYRHSRTRTYHHRLHH